VREARDEAKKEIETYRANKEAEYKEFEAKVLQSLDMTRVGVLTVAAHTREQGGRRRGQQGGRCKDSRDPEGGEEGPGTR